MLSKWASPRTSFEHANLGLPPLSSKSSVTTISWRLFLMCPRRGPAAPRSREVRENAADALEEAILAYLAHGRPIPDPREPRGGEEAIILDPVTAARAGLATAMQT